MNRRSFLAALLGHKQIVKAATTAQVVRLAPGEYRLPLVMQPGGKFVHYAMSYGMGKSRALALLAQRCANKGLKVNKIEEVEQQIRELKKRL